MVFELERHNGCAERSHGRAPPMRVTLRFFAYALLRRKCPLASRSACGLDEAFNLLS
jgi:hypothetical protein